VRHDEKLEDVEWARDTRVQRLLDAERRVDTHLPEDVVERALERTRAAVDASAGGGGPGVGRGWMTPLALGVLLAASGAWLLASRSTGSSPPPSSPAPMPVAAEAPRPSGDETNTYAAAEGAGSPRGPAQASAPNDEVVVDVAALPSAATRAPSGAAATTKRAPAAASSERPETEASRLASERALIVAIRDAIRRRDFATASGLIARHESEYPHGQFVEQRKALHVWLTRDQGKDDQADREAREFQTEHPKSLMLPSVGATK